MAQVGQNKKKVNEKKLPTYVEIKSKILMMESEINSLMTRYDGLGHDKEIRLDLGKKITTRVNIIGALRWVIGEEIQGQVRMEELLVDRK